MRELRKRILFYIIYRLIRLTNEPLSLVNLHIFNYKYYQYFGVRTRKAKMLNTIKEVINESSIIWYNEK